MTTTLLIVALVILVLALVAVLVDCCRSPMMWVLHLCCDTVGGLLKAVAWVIAGLGEAISSS